MVRSKRQVSRVLRRPICSRRVHHADGEVRGAGGLENKLEARVNHPSPEGDGHIVDWDRNGIHVVICQAT